MDVRINTFVNILPFGNIQYKSRAGTVPCPEETRDRPRYQLPGTTGIKSLEFDLVDDINLVIPCDTEIEHD